MEAATGIELAYTGLPFGRPYLLDTPCHQVAPQLRSAALPAINWAQFRE
jgi:hypothetical protein